MYSVLHNILIHLLNSFICLFHHVYTIGVYYMLNIRSSGKIRSYGSVVWSWIFGHPVFIYSAVRLWSLDLAWYNACKKSNILTWASFNLRMKIKPGSKMRNLIPHSIGAVTELGLVLFSGYGPAVTKVVSIAEIVKRRFKNIHQTTRILYRQVRRAAMRNCSLMTSHKFGLF